jgi:hypothetical protein
VPVYVSKLRGFGRLLAGDSTVPPPWFVLTADSEEELHAIAARLGIRRDPGTPATPAGFVQETEARQYLLTEDERDRAAELGARAISARKAGRLERQRAAMCGEGLP